MSNIIADINKKGQSIWYDNIQRKLLRSGELESLIAEGDIQGITSNPTIFHKAIAGTADYDNAIISMAWAGMDSESIFWQLAFEDTQLACDLFLPHYHRSKGRDGFVSLEVHPDLANNPSGTIQQAQDIWTRVQRPNLMIKIPATESGLQAIRTATAIGINVNATLIFTNQRYLSVLDAYLSGLEDRLGKGKDISSVASVASFFISRMDTKIDALLSRDSSLRGKAAIANAKHAYSTYLNMLETPRWKRLAGQGARAQRPLWASTGTKDPAYPDTYYVDNLIGANTVNTVPPKTLDAIRDHGNSEETLTAEKSQERDVFAELEDAGISIQQVTKELEAEGISAFANAFSGLINEIDKRRAHAFNSLNSLGPLVGERLLQLEEKQTVERLWNCDPSLWSMDISEHEEIINRLGWLHLPTNSIEKINNIQSFASKIHAEGIRKVLLLGMGGSSLAPEVMASVFGACSERDTNLKFDILDSTDPEQIIAAAEAFPPGESMYIVSSKSGGTVEVNAMLEYFWQLSGNDGARFIAITDPGTSLDVIARKYQFRHIFHGDSNVGGRFSALSVFGLVPAALMGIDLLKLLRSAQDVMKVCLAGNPLRANPGAVLGSILGEGVLHGLGKLSIITDHQFSTYGSWLEQLIMESSGKKGRGIAVIDGDPVADTCNFPSDRMIVYLNSSGENSELINELINKEHSVIEVKIHAASDLGAQFYLWEMATAIACHIIDVNAFDQPDVQANKLRTIDILNAYNQSGKLSNQDKCVSPGNEMLIFYNLEAESIHPGAILDKFFEELKKDGYLAINAYIPRSPETVDLLEQVRSYLCIKFECTVTIGFGPRYLHSTGQYHKGGPNNGSFIQITKEHESDLEIPGRGYTFAILQSAQASGDFETLDENGRPIIRFHVQSTNDILKIISAIELFTAAKPVG